MATSRKDSVLHSLAKEKKTKYLNLPADVAITGQSQRNFPLSAQQYQDHVKVLNPLLFFCYGP